MAKAKLQDITSNIQPSSFLDYKLYLEALYQAMKRERGSYSYKKFTEDLGFTASTLMHQIIRGYRPLSDKAAAKVMKAADLQGVEKKYFKTLVKYTNEKGAKKRERLFNELVTIKSKELPTDQDKDTLEYLSEWYHPVVRELVTLSGEPADTAAIGAAVVPKLRPQQVRDSVDLLLRLGLIEQLDNGGYRQTDTRLSTGHRVRGHGIVAYHQTMIEHGRESLTRFPGKKRDVSAMTMRLNDEQFDRLKSMIHEFQMRVLEEAEKSDDGEGVYQLNLQFFPFTKV